jgi:hypothetical protein
MKKHLFSAWKKILLLTIGSFFAYNLIVAAEIDMEGPGSTVKITNKHGTVIDEPAVVTIRDSEQTIQKSNATIKQQNVHSSTEEIRPDGTRIIKNNDGSSVQTNPDGSQTIINNDGSSIQKNADGTQIIKNVSGEIIK